jgi:hypothetical protein
MKAGKTAGPAVSLAAKADILEEAQFSGRCAQALPAQHVACAA